MNLELPQSNMSAITVLQNSTVALKTIIDMLYKRDMYIRRHHFNKHGQCGLVSLPNQQSSLN